MSSELKPIEWKKISPQYGWGFHVFLVQAGPFRLIDARTSRGIGQKDKEEPLWYGKINNSNFGPYWKEEEAMETMNKALKFAGYALPSALRKG